MKNKWIIIVVILICCLVYAIVKLSMSENQNISQYQDANTQEKETPGAKQNDADNTDKATPEEDSGTPATADQVEAITKVFGEFLSALKSEDYEQAWKLMSKSFKSKVSFEEFKEPLSEMGALLAEATIRPGSATNIDGRVRLLVTAPSFDVDLNMSFIQEDEQWKLSLDF